VKLLFQPHAGAPVHAAGRNFGHDRLDPDGMKSFSHLFHLPRPAFSVHDNASHHVAGELVPVDAGEGLGQ
jgi:hypothetical protein